MPDYRLGFTTLDHEIQCDHLPVRGALPAWLRGSLVRNGPARFEFAQQSYRHWFDGLGMLHSFTVQDGQVAYANRFLQTADLREGEATGRITRAAFASDPCRSVFKRVMTLFTPPAVTENANVNVARLAGHYVAMTEVPLPIEFDPKTLQTLGVFDYGKDGLKGQATTAHPHFDYDRSAAVNYLLQFGRHSDYIVYQIPHGQTHRHLIGSVRVPEPAYMHSFGMTENFVILAEFPLRVNPLKLLTSGKPFILNYEWRPEQPTRFLRMSKHDGSVRVYEGPAFFAFHHVNAFEEGDDIVLDIAAYPDPGIIDAFYLDRLRTGGTAPTAELRRYRLPAAVGPATYERLSDASIELPRVNYARANGRDYQYTYGVSTRADQPGGFQNQLVKVDVRARQTQTWREDGTYPGEPVFVAAPDAQAEDDGVILSVVLDAPRGLSYLLVLDARSFTELARAEVPHAIPFGFHGQFFS